MKNFIQNKYKLLPLLIIFSTLTQFISPKEENTQGIIERFHITPDSFDKDKTILLGGEEIKAGDSFTLFFQTVDKNNSITDYFEILEHFELRIFKESDLSEEKPLNKTIQVPTNNTYIEITLILTLQENYIIKVYFDTQEIELKSKKYISVKHGDCSLYDPLIYFSKIENRDNLFFPGEKVTLNIQCKDAYGNIIENQGKENFITTIMQGKTTIPYQHEFKEVHQFLFIIESAGEYKINITLNGELYGKELILIIPDYNNTLYTCMDKRQVEELKDCVDIAGTYKEFILSLEGDNICSEREQFKEGKVFNCKVNGENDCVEHSNKCDCDEGFTKWMGYCFSEENNPIKLVHNNENKINCLTLLKAKGINGYRCEDGTCRLFEDECSSIFECPLGYKSCGNKCILLSEKCILNSDCDLGKVLCWDYSCAYSYELCPTRKTCNINEVICPDGSCQIKGHCKQPIKRKCNSEEYQCPDFSCVRNKEDCPKNKICPIGLSLCEDEQCKKKCKGSIKTKSGYKCPNGPFVKNPQLCPTEMFCPKNYIKCPNGGCSFTIEGCEYIQGLNRISCPMTKPILCPDFDCVENSNLCNKNIPSCPPYKPYQCWNNECRNSFDDCPTMITCPPDYPILCNSGFCSSSVSSCDIKETKCNNYQYRCFDGSCTSSLELCPTFIYCGKDKIKCWNGACAESIERCPPFEPKTCPQKFPYKCPDGSCRPDAESCSTISVCPRELPIKCFDNSCRESIEACPNFQSCGELRVGCPDGTCAKSINECNTIVTCDSLNPYLCYDGSCRQELHECPKPSDCGKQKVLCPNGVCASSRQFCKVINICEENTPIKCEMNTCTNDLNNCIFNERQCPNGYITCPNGECKTSESLCDEFLCPPNKPYKCPEGICVDDKNYCDNRTNACPFNSQIKCPDGTCVSSEKFCNGTIPQKEGLILCPDGSLSPSIDDCPLVNGCYKDRPFKCADGTCIDLNESSCLPIYCHKNAPVQCPNGLCVVKTSDCHSTVNPVDIDVCSDKNQIMCVDGRCVPSYEYCRPLFTCTDGYFKCLDNSCRISSTLCPENIKCPIQRPFRINTQNICTATNSSNIDFYCPPNYQRCSYTGECKENKYEEGELVNSCPLSPIYKNGCPQENQVKCLNGRCLNSQEECILSSNACPDDSSPYLCSNGECVSNLKNCEKNYFDNICEEGKIQCSSGRCVENNTFALNNKCTNEIGCPLIRPYRCSNGECQESQRKCKIATSLNNTFILNIMCDSSKPYLCSDFTCVSDYSFCKITVPCKEGFKCPNGYCVKNISECEKYINYCPQSNPIRCPSGSCSTNIYECPENSPKSSCKDEEFYCVRLSKCMSKKSECFIYVNNLIEDYSSILSKSFIKQKKSKIGLYINNDEIKEEKEVLCYDGTIASSNEKCPIVPACKIGQYRCENGGCSFKKELCSIDGNYTCPFNQHKCPDGLCHKSCLEISYKGCLVGEYQCSNGMCVSSDIECAGYSMCDSEFAPFRCMNGECKSDINLCEEIQRIGNIKNISYSFHKTNKIEFSFAYDTKGKVIGKITIPSNGLEISGNYSIINVEEVANSLVNNDTFFNNTPEFLYNVSNGIEGSEGKLNFDNSVMSPIFKFYSEENKNIKFKIPGLLTLEHNYYLSSNFFYYDYCLAKLEGIDIYTEKFNEKEKPQWKCIQRQTSEEQKEYKLDSSGIFAIILNPLRDKIDYLKDNEARNFFLDNTKSILISFGILIILTGLILYIFSRIMRYRGKYHDNLAKIELLKQHKKEFKSMSTDIIGQSLGDNLLGIVYSKNPGYNKEINNDENESHEKDLENDIEDIQRQCRNVELENEKLKEELNKLEGEYAAINSEIEQMKQKQQK